MPVYDLEGKVVLIVGASRGIGASAARKFAESGAKLVLGSRDTAAMEELAASLPATAQTQLVATDITRGEDLKRIVDKAVAQFGRLDIAVNNAGVSHARMPVADIPDEVFDATMNTNVRGVFQAMKHQIQAMLACGGGSIVNTGSISGIVTVPGFGAYCTSKAALASLTRAAAMDYAGQNIRVNLVAPGVVDTALTQAGLLRTPEGRELAKTKAPMGRVSEPEEIAEAIVWLASPAASFTTGAILPADGGYTLG